MLITRDRTLTARSRAANKLTCVNTMEEDEKEEIEDEEEYFEEEILTPAKSRRRGK